VFAALLAPSLVDGQAADVCWVTIGFPDRYPDFDYTRCQFRA
jgi:hypothetical protein